MQLSLATSRFAFALGSPDRDLLLDGAPAPLSQSMVDRYTSGYLGLSVTL